MSEKLRVDKIILATKSGKKKMELSIEEAKELYGQLGMLFGEKVNFVPSGGYYPTPIIIERDRWPYYPTPYKITWGSSNGFDSSGVCGDTATVIGDNIQSSYCCSST